MARNHFTFAIGLTPRFAHEDEPKDEDDLHREGEQSDSGAENLISKIFNRLIDSDLKTAHATLELANALRRMAESALKGNENHVEGWANRAADLINSLESDNEGDEE
jgi:hypothetical protein